MEALILGIGVVGSYVFPDDNGRNFSCCYTNYDLLAPKKAIQEDLVINTQDVIKDKLLHLIESFQQINSRDIRYNENRNKADFSAVCIAVLLYF